MHVYKRAALYLARKKGKAVILFALFFLVSLLLVIGGSIHAGTRQATKDLRSNIGAAFYVRPYEQFIGDNGELTSLGTPVISQAAIDEVKEAADDELKAYNTEHYGYAKGENLSFIPGTGHTEDNNMGKVTSVRTSELIEDFLNGDIVLTEGRHIQPDDENKILISREIAEQNHLKIGDILNLTHADFSVENGVYVDAIKEKTAFTKAEIVGIYQIKNNSDDTLSPTAALSVNRIYADSQLLVNLEEQEQGIFEGEISFFIADPLHLEEIIKKVEAISSIDWKNHILVDNDFQYSKIAGQLYNIQKLVLTLIVIASVLSMVVLMLILTMRIRGRMQEAGILLAVGKTKTEIIGQFSVEAIILLLIGFLLVLILATPLSAALNHILFGSLLSETPLGTLQTGGRIVNYLQPNLLHVLILFGGELAAVILTVIMSSGAILSLKPKEILSKMS